MASKNNLAKQKEISEKLQHSYKRDEWKKLLKELFPNAKFFSPVQEVDFTRKDQERLANRITSIGEVKLEKNEITLQNIGYGDDKIRFIEVELKGDEVNLTKNRVGLRNLVSNEVVPGLTDAALIAYYQPDEKEWRITFYSEKYDWDSEGRMIVKSNHRKRYTYVVGPTETCKTAGERFVEIIKAGEEVTLETVLRAFSVQKVSDEFFDEYKYQYDKFVGYITGTVYTKDGEQEYLYENIGRSFSSFFKVNSEDPKKTARNFVKKLLGRIIFLYFVQKKGWLGDNYKFIQTLFEKAKEEDQADLFYHTWLHKLFFEGLNTGSSNSFELPDGSTVQIPFLNGGLFEMDEVDKKLENFTLPAWLFHNPAKSEEPEDKYTYEVKRGFLDFLNAFNFTVHEDSPGDHTIAVDPEMLGHIFENLLEDNKEKGAYYTPKAIVHYMCQESIIEYLFTSLTGDDAIEDARKDLREKLEDLVKNQNVGRLSANTREILQALQSIKVCDPAIGSGAFPMGILQEIFQIVDTFHFYESDGFYEGWQLEDGSWKPADVKKQIIQNSIYGVDIEKGAVDIARLRFWLSLIVDEENPTPLPNLDYKIITGDSLVSRLIIDNEEQIVNINWEMEGKVESTEKHLENLKSALNAIVDKQKKYFDADSTDKQQLKYEIDRLKIEALIHQLHFDREDYVYRNKDEGNLFEENTERKLKLVGFNELIKKLEAKIDQPESVEFFDWKLDFPEMLNEKINKQPGFDIIIANPPYLGESGHKEKFRRVRLGPLSEYYLGKMDYFYFFMHLALNHSNEYGINTFITTNYYLTADGALHLRKDLKQRSDILQLINFGELKVFDSARGQHNLITLFQKGFTGEANVHVIDVKKSGVATGNELNTILNDIDEQTEYRSFKSSELYDGSKDYIRLSGTVSTNESDVNGILSKISGKTNDLLGDLAEINQGVVSGCDKFTNRFVEKVDSLSKIEINDGIYVFEFDNPRDIKTIDSFNEQEKKFLKPFFKNSDISKYNSNNNNSKNLLYLNRDVTSIDRCPNIERHLKRFEGVLKDRREYKNGRIEYFQLQWPRNESIFTGPKICVPYRVEDNCFAYNEVDWYCRSDCYLITEKGDKPEVSLKYLLGLLNSKLFFFWLYHRGKRKGETLELFYTPLSEIPIYLASKGFQSDLINRVEGIESAKQNGENTDLMEKEIDVRVYKLYDLTWEEVQTVDPDLNMPKDEYDALEIES